MCTLSFALRRNSTVPSIRAKIVWSRPSPTLLPGCHLVPRWRIRMLPAMTLWPPDFLTPRRRPSVSRPLRDDPPAFLCAMGECSSGRVDAGDPQHGDMLAMPVAAAAVLPAALFEDDDLVQPILRDHGRGDRRAGNGGAANGQAGVASDAQDVVEGHRGAGL